MKKKVTCPRCNYTFNTSTAISGTRTNRLYTQCYRCKKVFPIHKIEW